MTGDTSKKQTPAPPPPPPPMPSLKRRQEEPEDEGWLITFADMSVLLMCFFVVLFMMSSPNEEQFKVMSKALREHGFYDDEVPLSDPFNELRKALLTSIATSGFDSYVTASETPKGIYVDISASALFHPGSAELDSRAQPILELLAKQVLTIKDSDATIEVEGYTDDTPISTIQFPSNWELSSARAARVVRFLIQEGVPEEKLRAVGMASTRAKAPNRDAAGNAIAINQDLNRRVLVKLLKNEDR